MQATLALRFGGEGILKVKGIPFKASGADVRKFFTGYKIKPGGVSFIMHADGRPTGMAFIEFATPQEAVRAMVGWSTGAWVPFTCHLLISIVGSGAVLAISTCIHVMLPTLHRFEFAKSCWAGF